LEKRGHICDIKYYNDDELVGYDIVHAHVFDQCLFLKEKHVLYFFTMHDIHPYLYGDRSPLYNSHSDAINHSIITFSPNKFFIEYFNSNKIFYLFHGDDKVKNILCVAANGKWNDEHDCKGFVLACEVAKAINLNITLAGPNEEWFKKTDYDFSYNKLSIINKNLNKEEIRELYLKHDILFNLSTNESGQPNLVILEALSSGLPVLCTSIDDMQISGTRVVKRDIQSTIIGVNDIIQNKREYYHGALLSSQKYSWKNVCSKLEEYYLNSMSITPY
jgi:glycosyltransferase involved in cell wall biosynthesis